MLFSLLPSLALFRKPIHQVAEAGGRPDRLPDGFRFFVESVKPRRNASILNA
jgi:hypothetical protein